MPFSRDFTHLGPFLHGGILSSLADAAISAALIPNCPIGSRISAIDMNTRFCKSLSGGTIKALAKITFKGKKICHLKAELLDGTETPIAIIQSSYLIEPPQKV